MMSERLYRERLWGAELGELQTRPALFPGETAIPVFDEEGHWLEWVRFYAGFGRLRQCERLVIAA